MARATQVGWWMIGAVVLSVVFAMYWMGHRRGGDKPVTRSLEESSAGPAAGSYVGSRTCAECHPGEHASYRETAHSRSLAEVHADEEPPPGSFFHAASGRRYAVRREETEIRHREWLELPDEASPAVNDYSVCYLVGSGRHTRTYLIDDGGFLAESPITWYQSRRAWGLSPGYDVATNAGFERAADVGCLFCHAGRIETVGGSDTRLVIKEQAIGCERCHGPGESHVEQHRNGRRQTDANAAKVPRTPEASGTRPVPANDEMIVHPGRLSRALREAICAECHLVGNAMVLRRGRHQGDFRPGLPLSSYRADYRLDTSHAQMKVVGHVDQMRLSRCYRENQTLTCTTCHDPMERPPRRNG